MIVSDHIYHIDPPSPPQQNKTRLPKHHQPNDVVNVHQAPGRLQGHVERMLALKRSEAMDPSDEVVDWGGWQMPLKN